MAKKWVPVPGIKPIKFEDGKTYQLARGKGELTVLIEVDEPEWVDVTSECQIRQETSQRNGGLYSMLTHVDVIIAYYSPIHTIMKHTADYKVELAKGATVSFRVFKLRR